MQCKVGLVWKPRQQSASVVLSFQHHLDQQVRRACQGQYRTPSYHRSTADINTYTFSTNHFLLFLEHHLTTLTGKTVITFRMRHSRGEMYTGHGRLSVCFSLTAFPHYCMDLDVTWGNGNGCPLVMHYWTDLQSVHGFRCYGNIHCKCL